MMVSLYCIAHVIRDKSISGVNCIFSSVLHNHVNKIFIKVRSITITEFFYCFIYIVPNVVFGKGLALLKAQVALEHHSVGSRIELLPISMPVPPPEWNDKQMVKIVEDYTDSKMMR